MIEETDRQNDQMESKPESVVVYLSCLITRLCGVPLLICDAIH